MGSSSCMIYGFVQPIKGHSTSFCQVDRMRGLVLVIRARQLAPGMDCEAKAPKHTGEQKFDCWIACEVDASALKAKQKSDSWVDREVVVPGVMDTGEWKFGGAVGHEAYPEWRFEDLLGCEANVPWFMAELEFDGDRQD